jgi:CIC family chloride channel protein
VIPKSPQKFSISTLLKASEHTTMTILAVVVGLAGGFGAIGFRYLIEFFQSISYRSVGNLIEAAQSLPWVFRIGIPAAGGLLVGPLVYFFAREAKGHGVPEVMEAVALKSGIIESGLSL